MNKVIKLEGILVFALILFGACEYHNLDEPPDAIDATDESLFDEANGDGFTYYQNGNLIPSAPQSAHGIFKLRFNQIAAGALGPDGELPENSSFPIGSVVVKENFQGSTLNILAVMKKVPADIHANAGWIWAGYYIDGTTAISIEENGSACVSCHSETPNRDLVRTFDFH